MINPEDINKSIWKKLSSISPQDTTYTANLIGKVNSRDESGLYIFNDENGSHHFLIQVSKNDHSIIVNIRASGLLSVIRDYPFADGSTKSFIDLQLHDDVYLEQFSQLVKEIAERICLEPPSRIRETNRILTAWKAFWREMPSEILTIEKQLGLFCELKFLERVLQVDRRTALEGWTGPDGGLNDFNLPAWSIEIKATLSDRRVHIVNGLEQLEVPEDRQLGIVSSKGSHSTQEDGQSLQSLIEEIAVEYLEELYLIEMYYRKLSNAGYSRKYSEDYSNHYFKIGSTRFFEVDSEFPCLTRSNISSDILERILNVIYQLDLEGLDSQPFDEVSVTLFFGN